MSDMRSPPAGDLHLVLSGSAGEVPRARRVVRDWLRATGLNGHEPTAELVVSELVTNALRHGRPPVELRVGGRDDGMLRIEVLDGAAHDVPVPSDAPPDAVTGRGLGIVAAMAERWGSEPAGNGKLVWAELRRSSG